MVGAHCAGSDDRVKAAALALDQKDDLPPPRAQLSAAKRVGSHRRSTPKAENKVHPKGGEAEYKVRSDLDPCELAELAARGRVRLRGRRARLAEVEPVRKDARVCRVEPPEGELRAAPRAPVAQIQVARVLACTCVRQVRLTACESGWRAGFAVLPDKTGMPRSKGSGSNQGCQG